MLIDWPRFIGALVLLLVPIGLFHGAKVRYRPVSRDWDRHWLQILGLGLHAIDLGRAVLGAWLLVDALALAPGAKGPMRYAVLLTHAGVLWLAAILQAVVCKEKDSWHAPFAFATGLVLGYFSPNISAFPIILAAIVALGTRKPAVYFVAISIFLFGSGFLFAGKRLLLAVAVVAGAVLLPSFASLLFRRKLVISYRARRGTDSTRVPFADTAQT